MTTPVSARGWASSPRLLAGWALVGYAAVYLVFAFFDWVLPGDGTLTGRSAGAGFTSLTIIAMPVIAVLLATHVQPTLSQAKVIAAVAVAECAAILVFGVLALLIGVGAVADDTNATANDAFDVLAYFALGLGRLALAAVAGLVSYQAFAKLGGRVPVGINWRTTTPNQTPPSA
jgi:hypothetical protein